MNVIKNNFLLFCLALGISIIVSACEGLIQIDAPKTELVQSTVFRDDESAMSALQGMYSRMIADDYYFSTFSDGIPCVPALTADEYSLVLAKTGFAENTIDPASPSISLMWRNAYQSIYDANALLEGSNASEKISLPLKNQITGEARFMRALHYFYLVNLYGEVPLLTNTDYQKNVLAKRTDIASIYEQIISDLVTAKDLLPLDYAHSGGKRVRANHWAASALLARVYLYTKKWDLAELESDAVINHKTLYRLEPTLATVFLANNQEAILQLYPNRGFKNAQEATLTYYNAALTPAATLTDALYNAFETGDLRKTQWTGTRLAYHYAYKYKARTINAPEFSEFSTPLRLAEQYLIRAEARGHRNNITGALDDLEAIRNRAGLGRPQAFDLASLMPLIEQERRVEFFTEYGHRWLDLKRWDRANAVLGTKPTWKPEAVLYPIPSSELLKNPNLYQNKGY